MPSSQGTTVGLSIGIPCGVVLVLMLIFWIRSHRHLKKEDKETDLDVELRDDHSFNRFQEELHRPYNCPQHTVTKSQPDEFVEKPSMTSTDSTSSTRIVDKLQKKNPSSYDFYDSFIPMLPENALQSSNALPENMPPFVPSHEDSSASLGTSSFTNNKSLEHLAKKLNNPVFFEKLPSRTSTFGLKQKSFSLSTSSSTDIINNLVQENPPNDQYSFDKKEEKHPYSRYAISVPQVNSKSSSSVDTTHMHEFNEPTKNSDLPKGETSSLESPFQDEL